MKIENEIMTIKDKFDALSMELEGSGGLKGTRKAGLEDEVQNIWSFLQRFADEHAMDKVEVVKNEAASIQDKIDILGWLGRYNEFVTLPMVTQLIVTFKDNLIPPSNPVLRNNYIQAKHSSHAVLNLVKQIQFLKYKFNDEDGK